MQGLGLAKEYLIVASGRREGQDRERERRGKEWEEWREGGN